ncbi:MAG TPA: hypothetical protein VGO11_07680 [Chthoniobacteraceae bacterium]|jgi:hypothetical protein|nr:hypothetical protein [Chthoniobacteraceae bacterium]
MKSLSLFALSLVSFGLSAFGGVDFGSAAGRTPYDSYMQPVKQVLGSLDGSTPAMDRVQALMRQGHGFFYSYDEPYVAQMPEVTAAKHTGDCKAKSLWLINQLGDSNVRFVVGKAHYGAKLSHAWVLWKEASSGRWYILDCTNNSRPVPADSVRQDDYIPLYSWSKAGVYRHAATQVGIAAVAGKRTAPGVATGDLAAR